MKKIIILMIIFVFITGCTKLNNKNINKIIKEVQNNNTNSVNQNRTGYRYYLPKSMQLLNINDRNETISDGSYKYYLYADLISYYNQIKKDYSIKDNTYMSLNINYKDKDGYLEIKVKNNQYLIEIMYNYAKIELIVKEKDIATSIANSLIILSTIKYNNDIIKNMLEENILNSEEETLNIFDTNNETSNFLDVVQKFGNYDGDTKSMIPDYDLVN